MRIRFVGEGVSDIGGEDFSGVVPILTRKVLAIARGDRVEFEPDAKPLPRFHRTRGFPAKAKSAIAEAHREGFDGIAIVVDRDGHKERLRLLREGRDAAARELPVDHVAIGVAVEALEAWLLADEQAIGEVIGHTVPRRADPESLDGRRGSGHHPKDRVNALLAEDEDRGRTNQVRLEQIAAAADVSEIERRCRQGFAPYADEVRRCLGSLFQRDG